MTEPLHPPPATGATLLSISWPPGEALTTGPDLSGARAPLVAWSGLGAVERGPQTLVLASIPAGLTEQPEAAVAAREALLARGDLAEREVTLLGLQGAHLVHAPGVIVVVAEPDRIAVAEEAAARAAIEAAEMRRLEETLAASWGPLRGLAPLAHRSDPELIARRPELEARFVELLGLREVHARLGPRVHAPAVYPPTLASQVAERLRDRLQLHTRHELVESSLLAQEQVHALCTERLGEYANSRKGHLLEWTIILLLGAEVVMMVLEALGSAGS